jgi:hypothetical protein
MSHYHPLWAVLAPGDPSWMKKRAYAALELEEDEEDEDGPPFAVALGSGHYHAIVGLDDWRVGVELQIAEALSLECDEPVYAIERANDPWLVMVFREGAGEVVEEDPEDLARSLGCPLPGSEESSDSPERKPLRKVALVEGVSAQEAHRVLEEDAGEPLPPGLYRLEDTPRGLLIADGTHSLSFAYINVSERLPHATVYGVSASPGFDTFIVKVLQAGECIGEFAQPPREDTFLPAVSEIKGERSPERILAALGIPPEWFRNE